MAAVASGREADAKTVAAETPPRSTRSAIDLPDVISEAEQIAHVGFWKWELASGRVQWSDELHRIYGLEPGEFEGTTDAFLERVHPDDRDRVWSHVGHSLETLEPFAFEERIVRADGSERILLSKGRVIARPTGEAEALVGVCHDVTERATAERALGASEQRMKAIMDNTPSFITVKDLDGRYLMNNAEAARITGVPDLTGMHSADIFPPELAEAQRANDRRAASEGEPVYGEASLTLDGEERSYLTVTFALADESGVPAETCTIATDVTERKEHESELRERLEWTERISSALDDNRVLAYAQPIVDLSSGAQVSTELLVRLQPEDEAADIVMPDTLIPPAERYGLVQLIDVWMVRRAIELASTLMVQVNVSAVTMSDLAARAEIVGLLEGAPEQARRLVFEITETADADYLEAAREFADAVTKAGSRLALDDFGIGFGSFTYLRSLPVSFLKIDRGFVRGLANSDDKRIVKSVIGIAREFGLETIAEGVEDPETVELLWSMGADFAQGYHLGHPAPVAHS